MESIRSADMAFNHNKKMPSMERIAYFGSMTICVFSIVYILSVFFTGRSWLPLTGISAELSELTLPFVQCVLGAAVLNVPGLLTKLTRIKLPNILCVLFYIFVICATVLGELFSLYYRVPIWDSLLHCGSGIMCGMLGSILVVNFLQKNNCKCLVTPMNVAVVAICVALCVGMVWEIYEFVGDSLLGMNMQKSLLEDGTALVGKMALADTMKDLIVDTVGALIAAVGSYLSIKNRKGWLWSYVKPEPLSIPTKVSAYREDFAKSA